MSEITFESGGRTWRYKDEPRRIEKSEHFWDNDQLQVRQWNEAVPTAAIYIPVEPVEPEEVTVTLRISTEVAKGLADHYVNGIAVDKPQRDEIKRQLREQGVEI